MLDFAAIHARKRIEAGNERAEQARYDQTIQDLTGQVERARATLEGARQVGENTPIELKAARDTESQARARYQAGLATIVEVAEAQRLLAQADVRNDVGDILRRQVLLQAFGHQRFAGARQVVEFVAQELLRFAVGADQSDRCAGLARHDAVVGLARLGAHHVVDVARLDGAIVLRSCVAGVEGHTADAGRRVKRVVAVAVRR